MWSILHHPNIFALLGFDNDEACGTIITLWQPRGDLARYFQNHRVPERLLELVRDSVRTTRCTFRLTLYDPGS